MDILSNPLYWVLIIAVSALVAAALGLLDGLGKQSRPAGYYSTTSFKPGALVTIQNYGNYKLKDYNETLNIATFYGLDRAFYCRPMFNMFPESFGAILANNSKENTWKLFIDFEDRGYLTSTNQDIKDVIRYSQSDAVRSAENRRLEEERLSSSQTSLKLLEQRMMELERANEVTPLKTLAMMMGARKRGGGLDDYSAAQTER